MLTGWTGSIRQALIGWALKKRKSGVPGRLHARQRYSLAKHGPSVVWNLTAGYRSAVGGRPARPAALPHAPGAPPGPATASAATPPPPPLPASLCHCARPPAWHIQLCIDSTVEPLYHFKCVGPGTAITVTLSWWQTLRVQILILHLGDLSSM